MRSQTALDESQNGTAPFVQLTPALVPQRYERMLASPFAFFRGAAAVMAFDLAEQPRTDLIVQLAGDPHLLNFGGRARCQGGEKARESDEPRAIATTACVPSRS